MIGYQVLDILNIRLKIGEKFFGRRKYTTENSGPIMPPNSKTSTHYLSMDTWVFDSFSFLDFIYIRTIWVLITSGSAWCLDWFI